MQIQLNNALIHDPHFFLHAREREKNDGLIFTIFTLFYLNLNL